MRLMQWRRVRKWLIGCILLAFGGTCLWGIVSSRGIRVERVELRLPGHGNAPGPLTILHVSDLHSRPGLFVNARLAELLREVEADLLLMTGDFRVSGGSIEDAAAGAHMVAAAVIGRMPVFAVEGNNDLPATMRKIGRSGVTVLDNTRVKVGPGIWLAGWNPYTRRRAPLERVIAGVPAGDFLILASHSPDVVMQPGCARANLVLAGHTHGGQIRLPGLPVPATYAKVGRKYISGLYPREGGALYVNRGIGTTMIPLRMFAPPEVTVLSLRAGQATE